MNHLYISIYKTFYWELCLDKIQTASAHDSAGLGRRFVDVSSGGKFSEIRTHCEVNGALCLSLSVAFGGTSKMLRMLRFTPPATFGPNIVAYGLDAKLLEELRSDKEFSEAAIGLLEKGYRLSLSRQTLQLSLVGRIPAELSEALLNSIAIAACRLEVLSNGVVNAEASLARIGAPWLAAAIIATLLSLLSAFCSRPSIVYGSLLPAIVVTLILFLIGTFLLLRMYLKAYALAGATAYEMYMTIVWISVFSAPALCIILNDFVGDKIVPSQSITVHGVVRITSGKGSHCALVLDHTLPVIGTHSQTETLPMPCAIALERGNSAAGTYDVKINAGLLGDAIVESFLVHETSDNAGDNERADG